MVATRGPMRECRPARTRWDVATDGQSRGPTRRHPLGRGRCRGVGRRRQIGRFHPAPRGVGRDRLVAAGETEQRRLRPGRADELEPDRQAVGQPARDGHAGQAGHVDRQRAGVREVHRDRVGQPVAEPEGDRRRGRRDQRIEALRPERVEIRLDQRPDLLRLQVVGVVVAGRQGVRPEHDPALDLRPEALAAGREVVGEDVAVAQARPEPDAVVAGEVRRRLGRRDDVVRGQAVVGVRQADLLDRRAGGLEGRDGLADACLDARLHAGHEVLARQAESLAAEAWRPPRRRRPAARPGSPGPARARTWSRGRRDRRSRGAAPPRRGRRGRTGRSGRASSRTRRSRSG